TRDSGREQRLRLAGQGGQDSDLGVDQLDLLILAELEHDGRQSVSDLARKLNIDRGNAGSRLKRLLDRQITRVVAFTNPFELGYHIFAMIGIKVSPRESDAVAERLRTAPHVYWVAKVAGRYDVIVWANFLHPADLSRLLSNEIGTIPGVLSTETMIGLELKKMSFAYLASSYLRGVGQPR
ncbi:MAG: Lrp/AsnC family transcriptional regulator, partial [Chloroflexi bacterium]|nr:Lrp/AsnC family transcriptional regulator [Chloroflexota bacterium]